MTRPPSRRGQSLGFKPGLQDQRRASLAAQQAMSHNGMSDAAKQHLAEFEASVKPKRERGPNKPRTVEQGKSEGEVQNEIIKYLVNHPRVHLVLRTNSGVAGDSFVKFTAIHLPRRFRVKLPDAQPEYKLPDLHVVMDDARICVIETKESGWRMSYTTSEKSYREAAQLRYLVHVRQCGGIGIFACSVGDVRVALILRRYGE